MQKIGPLENDSNVRNILHQSDRVHAPRDRDLSWPYYYFKIFYHNGFQLRYLDIWVNEWMLEEELWKRIHEYEQSYCGKAKEVLKLF